MVSWAFRSRGGVIGRWGRMAVVTTACLHHNVFSAVAVVLFYFYYLHTWSLLLLGHGLVSGLWCLFLFF